MKHPIVLQNVGLVEVVTLVEWTQPAGGRVAAGDVVARVETEKTVVDIEAPADGLLAIEVQAGPDVIPADQQLGYIDDGA